MYSPDEDSVPEIVCQGQTCGLAPPTIPAAMISYSDGQSLIKLLSQGAVTVQYNTTNLDHIYFGSDSFGNLAEGGWFLYPSLMFLDFQAQWYAWLCETLFIITYHVRKFKVDLIG